MCKAAGGWRWARSFLIIEQSPHYVLFQDFLLVCSKIISSIYKDSLHKYPLCADLLSLCLFRYQGEERGIQAYYKPSSSPSVHGFLGVGDLNRPVDGLWNVICQLSKSHMYNQSVRSVWTRPLDDSTQLGELFSLPRLYAHILSEHFNTIWINLIWGKCTLLPFFVPLYSSYLFVG